jgi:hypothetical protein
MRGQSPRDLDAGYPALGGALHDALATGELAQRADYSSRVPNVSPALEHRRVTGQGQGKRPVSHAHCITACNVWLFVVE